MLPKVDIFGYTSNGTQVYLPEHWGGGEKIFPDWHTVLASTGENPASHVTVHESPTNCPLSQVIIPLVTSIVSQDSARKNESKSE